MNRYSINKNGFTLIELLAVIAIIAILATIGTLATLKIYNDNIKKSMIIQENNVSSVAKTYLEDFCFDSLDNTYGCPQSYDNNTDKKYICLSNLQEKKDNSKAQDYNDSYINDVTYKKESCKGIVVFSPNDDGDYVNPKTYLYCDYDNKSKKYNYVTDESLNVSDYPICNIASGIDDSSTTTTTTTTTKPVQTACTYNGELKQGVEYVSGQYTYRYKQEREGNSWVNITDDGWGVTLTDKDSTVPVTTKLCNSINGKPIVSMRYMFYFSNASSIDMSSFDTSNVINMSGMFWNSKATILDLSKFNTNNVINMAAMFVGSQATTIKGLENFDTSKVTNMGWMFWNSKATVLNLSSFDTSNVTNMSLMFCYSKATNIDVSKFNTSKVTDMEMMFHDVVAANIDVSNFDTSNVTNMAGMFSNCASTVLNVKSFNTSKVKDMSGMFESTIIKELDLSSFDTRNVTNMNKMFYSIPNLKTIYASNKFITNNVTDSSNMFKDSTKLVGGFGTIYNSSKIDKTYAKIDKCNVSGYFTNKDFNAVSFDSDSWATIVSAVKSGETCKYNVGDTKEINLGSTYGTHTVRIANKSTPSSCDNSSFSQTACGFVIEFEDVILQSVMNDTRTNIGGWPATKMRTFLNNDIYNSLPSSLKNGIINTTVISGYGSVDTSNFTSTDKLYLFAPKEIYTDWTVENHSYGDKAINITRTLDYYSGLNVTTSNYSGAIKKRRNNADNWWLRNACYNYNTNFYIVSHNGVFSTGVAEYTYGVSPAFRIG